MSRPRHVSQNNRPFERFSFERGGVGDFGDVSYLLKHEADEKLADDIRNARRIKPPRLPVKNDKATVPASWYKSYIQGLRPGVNILMYTREEYRDLARALGIWEEAPRGMRRGAIELHPKAGTSLILAGHTSSATPPPSHTCIQSPSH